MNPSTGEGRRESGPLGAGGGERGGGGGRAEMRESGIGRGRFHKVAAGGRKAQIWPADLELDGASDP